MDNKPSLPHAQFAHTLDGSTSRFDREQLDIAFAAMALRSGTLSERELSKALSGWTIHGSVSLADHLLRTELIDETSAKKVRDQAESNLQSLRLKGLSSDGSPSESVLVGTLDAIDPSGKIAQLMGIRAAAGKGAEDSADRRSALLGYQLIRKIGQGGLGRVWLAFDEHLKRHVAIKEISGRENPQVLERFRREAKITGQLEHPGIVPIYQLGDDTQSGEAFYAMRFLGKSTLHDSIMEYHERRSEGDENPMLIRQLLTDFVNVCQAIGHAHSRKVIHRDLKPENIAIDSFGQVIVIDWGIAKVIDELSWNETVSDLSSAAVSSQSTMQGQVLGTPLYMAPEQAAGRVDELDERTDIYGLGAILFAILTGIAPHEKTRADTSAPTGRDLLSAITSRPTPSPMDVDPSIDRALAAICSKAMARKQYARYQSATQLSEDVQRWMAGESISAYEEKISQRVTRWVQRHRIWSQIIAASVIVGVVALVTMAIATRQSQLAARQVLFDEMRGYDREIEVQLESAADGLTKDTRFMSSLPPIQGIMDARANVSGSEGEDVWRGRLEMIYEGLLKANPNYLSISFTALQDDGGVDAVRVERHLSDAGFVRRVPESRLSVFADTDLLQQTTALSAGDILLLIRQPTDSTKSRRRDVRLIASTPVFDDTTGSLFGIVSIESDLLSQMVSFLERVEQTTASIYIADTSGSIWVSDDPEIGVDVKNVDINVANVVPGTRDFFTDTDQHRQAARTEGWLGNRITLDRANPQTTLSVVLSLRQ